MKAPDVDPVIALSVLVKILEVHNFQNFDFGNFSTASIDIELLKKVAPKLQEIKELILAHKKGS